MVAPHGTAEKVPVHCNTVPVPYFMDCSELCIVAPYRTAVKVWYSGYLLHDRYYINFSEFHHIASLHSVLLIRIRKKNADPEN